MNRRHAAILIFSLMLIGVVWWMKTQVDQFVELMEEKVDEAVVPLQPSQPPMVSALDQPSAPPAVEAQAGLQGEAGELMNQMLVRFNVGDYRAALVMADEAIGRADLGKEFHDWLRRQMPALLTSAAWLEIKLGNCQDAIGLLQRAYLVSKDEPVTKGLAFCHYRLKNWVSTEEFAKQYLKQQPGDAEVLMLYADALESEQRFGEAAQQMEKLVALEPEDEAFKKGLASMREKAKESVRQVALSSRYVELTYRAGEHEPYADFVINTLDRAVEEFVDLYGFAEPRDPIEVILYPGDNFQSLVSNGPDWAAGIFDGRMRIPIQQQYATESGRVALQRILRHELVHALFAFQANLRNLPSWFNEGLAQRLECSSRCRSSLFPPNPGDFLSAEDLTQPYTSYKKLKAERSYRQSLYMIYAIEHDREYGARDNLVKIIEQIDTHSDVTSDGLLKPIGLRYAELHERAARAWKNQQEFTDF